MNRRDAEKVLEEAASGAIPLEGVLLIRDVNGWIFEDLPSSLARNQQSALTAQDASTVDIVYAAAERDVIINNRTRIAEIEAVLQAYGMLP